MSTATAPARRVPPLIISALVVCSIGLIGGLLTRPDAWTASLLRPAWHPPAWVFGPVWGVIGICAAFAFASAWETLRAPKDRQTFLTLAGVNALLNINWSALFFFAERPDLALMDIAALWLSILVLIGFLRGRSASRAAALLGPYLAWVSIASALNFEIVRLNGLF